MSFPSFDFFPVMTIRELSCHLCKFLPLAVDSWKKASSFLNFLWSTLHHQANINFPPLAKTSASQAPLFPPVCHLLIQLSSKPKEYIAAAAPSYLEELKDSFGNGLYGVRNFSLFVVSFWPILLLVITILTTLKILKPFQRRRRMMSKSWFHLWKKRS